MSYSIEMVAGQMGKILIKPINLAKKAKTVNVYDYVNKLLKLV